MLSNPLPSRLTPQYTFPTPQKANGTAAPMKSPVRFGGVGDAISAFVAFTSLKQATELFLIDFCGMLAPRTTVAAWFRGIDDARETLIREGAGLVCVTLLAGFTNQFMTRVLGNRVGTYNPHGTPAKAWIGAENMRVFSQRYEQALTHSTSAPQARQAFVEHLLGGLESSDRALNLEGRLASLKTLSQSPSGASAAQKALADMVQALPGKPNKPEDFQRLLQAGKWSELRTKLLESGWGKLSNKGLKKLTAWFAPKATETAATPGITALDPLAWKQVSQKHPGLQGKALQNAFLQERLKLSLNHLQSTEPAFTQAVEKIALNQGLTGSVQLKEGGKTLLASQSRQTVLQELKHFLEHYVDRATFEAGHTLQGKAAATQSLTAQKQLIRQKLFATTTGWRKLLPQAGDGLVTAMMKAKTGYTLFPIVLAIAANGVSTFLNNYVTQRKYNGRVFFPGEEASIPKPVSGLAPLQTGRIA